MDKDVLNEKLQKAIKFTKSDLSMNKQGMLTPSQIHGLKNNDLFNGSKMSKLVIGIAIGGFVLGIGREGLHAFSLQFILPFLGIFALIYGGLTLYNKSNLKTLEEGKLKVEKIEGKLITSYDPKIANASSMGQYSGVMQTATNFAGINYADYANILEIGGKKLTAGKEIFDSFEKIRNMPFILSAFLRENIKMLFIRLLFQLKHFSF